MNELSSIEKQTPEIDDNNVNLTLELADIYLIWKRLEKLEELTNAHINLIRQRLEILEMRTTAKIQQQKSDDHLVSQRLEEISNRIDLILQRSENLEVRITAKIEHQKSVFQRLESRITSNENQQELINKKLSKESKETLCFLFLLLLIVGAKFLCPLDQENKK
jgi:hypothetical protein